MEYLKLIIWIFIIVQQPINNPLYVSEQPNEVTHFEQVDNYDVYGLLAHDYLAGREFYNLRQGDKIIANGNEFQVIDVKYYDSNKTDDEIFREVYTTSGRLVLQTCWGNGFMFIIGEPTGEYDDRYINKLAFIKNILWNSFLFFDNKSLYLN